ncbi:hypothetical protein N9H48_08400 [Pseudoalteromonas marina]|uniref:hypothetical protein n=1 Tax=Pseudoalteromonas sp. H71 TaxID=1348395 RepID=UPI0007317A8F|nr:hypothetical protein [Pseudoalteromonas sp. H71]KTD96452.1 hypothetical protein ATS71_16090 [Pseudoalteromonas sp. H71]MDA8940409.1 hypothetical protein [Pseudoalteromonas marina]
MRIILVLLLVFSFQLKAENLISKSEVASILPSLDFGVPSTDVIQKNIEIGKDLIISIEFAITSKGNGGIELPGIFLVRLYDRHDDLSYFKDGLLNNELIDVNSDGYKDILLWGTAVKSDDDGNKLGDVSVLAILVYSPKDKIYKVLRKSEEIDIYTNE